MDRIKSKENGRTVESQAPAQMATVQPGDKLFYTQQPGINT